MAENRVVARPYAKAIFDLAVVNNALQEWSATLSLLSELSLDPLMQKALLDPRLTTEQRMTLFVVGATKGARVNPGTFGDNVANLLKVLSRNNRLINLPEIYRLYEEFRAEHEKTVRITAYSTQELSSSQQQKLTMALTKKYSSEIELTYQLDPNLIGGILLKSGDHVIDGSLRGLLHNLRKQLLR